MRSAEDRIIEYLRASDSTDRQRLAAALRLPEPTVASAVRKLAADGAVEVDETPSSTPGVPGRPRKSIRAAGPAPLLGIVSWEPDRLLLRVARYDGTVLQRRHAPLPAAAAGTGGLATAVAALRDAASAVPGSRLTAVVVSAPAPFLHGTGVPETPTPARARRFPVPAHGDPEAALSRQAGLPVLIENDANLAALGELFAGRADGDHFLYLKLNDHGFGSALVVDGRLVRGARGYAGELAHLQMHPDGPVCECGGRGCLWASVRTLAVAATRNAYPAPVPFGELPARARAGDRGAARLLRDVGRTIGRPIGHLATVFDPQFVVVDGALGPEVEHVVAGIRESLATSAPPLIADEVDVLVSDLGEQAEITGAIELTREAARLG